MTILTSWQLRKGAGVVAWPGCGHLTARQETKRIDLNSFYCFDRKQDTLLEDIKSSFKACANIIQVELSLTVKCLEESWSSDSVLCSSRHAQSEIRGWLFQFTFSACGWCISLFPLFNSCMWCKKILMVFTNSLHLHVKAWCIFYLGERYSRYKQDTLWRWLTAIVWDASWLAHAHRNWNKW